MSHNNFNRCNSPTQTTSTKLFIYFAFIWILASKLPYCLCDPLVDAEQKKLFALRVVLLKFTILVEIPKNIVIVPNYKEDWSGNVVVKGVKQGEKLLAT